MKTNFRKLLLVRHSLFRTLFFSIVFMSLLAAVLYILITSPA